MDLATGGYVRAGMKTVQNIAKKMFDGLSDKSAKEVAELLYTKDPKQKYQIVKQILNESKKTGAGLQSTQAAQKLKAFYAISDSIRDSSAKKAGASAVGAGVVGSAAGAEKQPLRITIRPSDKTAPASIDFNDLIPNTSPRSEAPKNDLMGRIAQVESGGNPNAKNPNSSASGLYQFTDDTWRGSVSKWGKEYGIGFDDKNNPQAQEIMAKKLAEDNANILTAKLKREPNIADIYMAHVFGASQAVKLLSQIGSNRAAISMVPPKVVRANMGIFFNGNRPRTVEQVYALLGNKITS